MIISPPLTEAEIEPGSSRLWCVTVRNRTEQTIDAVLEVEDLEVSSDLDQLGAFVDQAQYGIASWVDLSMSTVTLAPGEDVIVPYTISVPTEPAPPVGSNMGGIVVRIPGNPPEAEEQGGGSVRFLPRLVSQVHLVIPGDLQRNIIVDDLRSERLVEHGTHAATDIQLRNTGNTTAHVTVTVEMKGLIGGRVVKRMIEENRLVLRDGRRELRMLWTDVPWIGVFQPTVHVEYEGKTIEKELPLVWVIPPWEYVVGLAIALMIPLGYTIWRRRRDADWRQYLDEEEAWDGEEW